MRFVALLAVVATGLSIPRAPLRAQMRPVTAEDYFNFKLVSDPHVSPDGARVIYVVARVDKAQNRRVPSVWIALTDGSAAPEMLVDESWSPATPRWSPDGA